MGCALCKEEDIDFNAEVDLRHFELLRSVGKGSFGKVRIVQKKDDKKMYALKYINKKKCIEMHAVDNIIQERKLLEEIEYPLIVNLRYAFQDDENMFMVLDLMLGGDLRYHLDRLGSFPEPVVKFYAAEIALGLGYLHSQNIVHRDLKPDNLLLDEKGHIHLTDFNIAVRLRPDKLLRSVSGTRAYMAPEVLNKQGYTTTPDWWSLGVVMYECVFGKRPFRGKTNEDLSNAILTEDIKIPPSSSEASLVSDDCISVLKGLLNRSTSKRLGCGPNGFEELKAHPFFKGVEWLKLEKKDATSPFVPDTQKANFDATYELEEMLLEDNPLKAKKPKKRTASKESTTNKEMLQMEEKFKSYNTCRKNPVPGGGVAEGFGSSNGALGGSTAISSGGVDGMGSEISVDQEREPGLSTQVELQKVSGEAEHLTLRGSSASSAIPSAADVVSGGSSPTKSSAGADFRGRSTSARQKQGDQWVSTSFARPGPGTLGSLTESVGASADSSIAVPHVLAQKQQSSLFGETAALSAARSSPLVTSELAPATASSSSAATSAQPAQPAKTAVQPTLSTGEASDSGHQTRSSSVATHGGSDSPAVVASMSSGTKLLSTQTGSTGTGLASSSEEEGTNGVAPA